MSLMLFGACNGSKYYMRAHSDSVNPKKRVYDEFLLVNNSILNNTKEKPILCEDSVSINPQSYKLDRTFKELLTYELQSMIRQKPNKNFLGTKPFLFIHNLSDTLRIKYKFDKKATYFSEDGAQKRGLILPDTLSIKKRVGDSIVYKSSRLRKFIMTNIGEDPIVFDSLLAAATANSMQNNLIQKGFIWAKVGYKIKLKGHKARVEYYYSTGKPIIVNNVIYQSEDTEIDKILENVKGRSELKVGMPMDKSAFIREKTRLTLEIRNRGYYNFNLNYISYVADTVNAEKLEPKYRQSVFGKKISSITGEQGETRVNIYVNVILPSDTVKKHPKFSVDKVFVVLDEPKVEIHKINRRFQMDTSYVVLRAPRKKGNLLFIKHSHIIESDSVFSLFLNNNKDEEIYEDIFNKSKKTVFLAAGTKYPHWIEVHKNKSQRRKNNIADLLVDSLGNVELNFPKKENQSFFSLPVYTHFDYYNSMDSSWYSVRLKPYRRRFFIDVYKNPDDIKSEDIPLHIVLRKAAKSLETDPKKAAKEISVAKRKNFIIRDKTISQFVQIGEGGIYNYDAAKETVNRISELEIFRFPRIEYVPSKTGEATELDAYVFMQKAKKQSFGADTDVNTSNANLGWALNLNYKNRNVFKGAELFMFNVEGGVNFNMRPDTNYNVKGIVRWINLLDLNSSLSLYFPKILGFRNWTLSVDNAKSRLSVSYNYLQQSTDFRVSSFDASLGYDWTLSKRQHIFTWLPLMLNFTLKPILDPVFESRLKESNFALWASLNANYFLPGTNFTYQFHPRSTGKNLWQLKFFAETTGTTARLLDYVAPLDVNLFGTTYSQYIKGDIDIRFTHKFSKNHTIATRLLAGAAVPVGKTDIVPFPRQFFLGGPASMRGWNMRELGPGRLRGTPGALFQLGDIRLEMNAEYRFMLNSWIGGALFVDAGNIWLSKVDKVNTSVPFTKLEQGEIGWDFLSELAMDIGTGIRFDLSFFVLRFDLAVPVRNPAGFIRRDQNGYINYFDENGSPIYWKFDWRSTNFALAVGYPF